MIKKLNQASYLNVNFFRINYPRNAPEQKFVVKCICGWQQNDSVSCGVFCFLFLVTASSLKFWENLQDINTAKESLSVSSLKITELRMWIYLASIVHEG